jgi:ribosome-associated translation inhibitor RaiA
MSSTKSSEKPQVIQYIGVGDLQAGEREVLNQVVEGEIDKLKRKHPNDSINGTLQVKVYQKEGDRRKYSMHLKIQFSKVLIDSSNHDDWDLPTALHKAFESVHNQLQHKNKF